ncbi:ST3 beta-galactoside alpha-2,3-sialyltransferase 3 [Rhinolophus ferrumequinum]|uniref:ST3 beta-galactoside alpha-2,3-sialyltransferase 3 n=1 Tax=Rhinolophus ferrumequinum TaxID=59479 RepID=A0A7J7X7X1_RHIFE|nr:ST3 beta-galactoside alpha-2,3-sialyltransferase 3 [Rhinolophus ferrumequinum]
MGLLVFVRNLLLALCLFLVLGFLYYSAWKLHLLQWEDSKYDRLGFLLKLDSKLPAELATKYANFSEGACKPGYASALMTAIFPRFSKPAPMFLDDSFRKWARIREFVPPFGIKGQEPTTLSGLGVQPWSRQTWPLSSESSSLLEIQIFRVQDSKGSGGGRTRCCEIIENECQRHEH